MEFHKSFYLNNFVTEFECVFLISIADLKITNSIVDMAIISIPIKVINGKNKLFVEPPILLAAINKIIFTIGNIVNASNELIINLPNVLTIGTEYKNNANGKSTTDTVTTKFLRPTNATVNKRIIK